MKLNQFLLLFIPDREGIVKWQGCRANQAHVPIPAYLPAVPIIRLMVFAVRYLFDSSNVTNSTILEIVFSISRIDTSCCGWDFLAIVLRCEPTIHPSCMREQARDESIGIRCSHQQGSQESASSFELCSLCLSEAEVHSVKLSHDLQPPFIAFRY